MPASSTIRWQRYRQRKRDGNCWLLGLSLNRQGGIDEVFRSICNDRTWSHSHFFYFAAEIFKVVTR